MSKKAKNLPAPMRPWASPEGHGAHYLNVEWAMPPATTPPAEFEVQYGFRLLGKWFTHARGLTDDPACEQRRVEPLKPSEKYTIRVRARFAGQGWGPWSPKSETMVTLADGATAGGSPRVAGFEGEDPAMKQFGGVDESKLKPRYDAVWRHKVAAHRGDPGGASTEYKLPVSLAVDQHGFAMFLKQTDTIQARFDLESIKAYRCNGSSTFTMVVGMLNDANASATMWAHGMDAHRGTPPCPRTQCAPARLPSPLARGAPVRSAVLTLLAAGEAPYHFEYSFETKEGKLIGAAILKATQQGRLAEEDRMRQLMFDAAPRTMAEGESRFKG